MKHLSIFAYLLCISLVKPTFAQKNQLCSKFDNRIVVNGDKIFSVKQCVLHPILDSQIYNLILEISNIEPIEISNVQYAALPIGTFYTESDFAHDYLPSEARISNICKIYKNQIVSADNINFYYIENCQKRKFLNSHEAARFRNITPLGAIRAISYSNLSKIQEGKDMEVPKISSNSKKSAIEILKSLPSRAKICNQLKTRAPTPFVAYYGSIFYFENCELYPVPNLTVEQMQQADDAGGIYELSTEEILALPQGTQWNKKK